MIRKLKCISKWKFIIQSDKTMRNFKTFLFNVQNSERSRPSSNQILTVVCLTRYSEDLLWNCIAFTTHFFCIAKQLQSFTKACILNKRRRECFIYIDFLSNLIHVDTKSTIVHHFWITYIYLFMRLVLKIGPTCYKKLFFRLLSYCLRVSFYFYPFILYYTYVLGCVHFCTT